MDPLEHSGLHWYVPPLSKLARHVVWSVEAAPGCTAPGARDRHDQIDDRSRHRRYDTRRSKLVQR
jgi:hypothetical protein